MINLKKNPFSFFNMSSQQKRKREKFLPEEDRQLRELVAIHGDSSWDIVAKNMPNRNQRQCRERWKHYLSSSKAKVPWTPEEDDLLYQKMNELGPKWTKIAKYFDGRTDIQIKTRWMQRFAMFSDLHIRKKRNYLQPQPNELQYNNQNNNQKSKSINPIQQNQHQQQILFHNNSSNQFIQNGQEVDLFGPNSQFFECQFDNANFDSPCFF